ncbi:MAG: hypothetical protein ACRD8W_23600 [Nitrososphaeraceae archaeon]
MSRAERKRIQRNELNSAWIYFKPIDLVNKRITIQLGDRGGDRLFTYLHYAIADIFDRYGVMNVYIETNVKPDKAGELTGEEQESCRIGNSLVYHPPELEQMFPEYRYR